MGEGVFWLKKAKTVKYLKNDFMLFRCEIRLRV